MTNPTGVTINWARLAEASRVRRAQDRMGTREVAALLGTSAATVSRVEAGKPCDALTYVRLTLWLRRTFVDVPTVAA